MASVKLTYTDPETGSSASTTFTGVLVTRGWYEFDDMELFPGIQHSYLSGSMDEQISGFRRRITIDFGVISSFASRKAILYFLKDSARQINLVIVAPTTPSASLAAGGTLADDTWYYRVTSVDDVGETTGCTEVNATTSGSNNSVLLNWDDMTGATSYRVYRSTTSSVYTSASDSGLHFVAAVTASTYTDTGAVSPLTSTYVLPTVQALSVALVNPGGYQNEWLGQVQLGRRYVCELYDQTLRTTLTP
jgi:hypothetical protein